MHIYRQTECFIDPFRGAPIRKLFFTKLSFHFIPKSDISKLNCNLFWCARAYAKDIWMVTDI